MQSANEIRKQFLDFFRSKGHEVVPSAPIVIKNDPTLLFTNAGMNQFKDYFLGNRTPEHTRIADTQKCLRVSGKHNDLEEVGVDTYHHTMFEMLGNWSFGDYFKEEAIAWSWELLTEVYGIPKDKLYVTVFQGDAGENLPKDEEAYNFWKQHVAEDRILLGNKKDNFWEMGDTGPCGPCSEIHVDCRTEEEKKKVAGSTLVNADHPQVIEIWNNVFMQYNRQKDGSLVPLPAKHVDTGMGLERLVRVLQGKQSNYDTDLFTGTIAAIENITHKKYGYTDSKQDVAFRVLSDHIRAIGFTIADGQLPSNTGAGYVIRRILRRAVRYYYSYLDHKQPLLHRLMPVLAKQFEDVFPELHKQIDLVTKVVKEEEDAFLRTLDKGLKRMDALMPEKATGTANEVTGEKAFELHDTYGFPIELTLEMAAESGLTVDELGFRELMAEQRRRAKADAAARKHAHADLSAFRELVDAGPTEFTGFDELASQARILGIFVDGKRVPVVAHPPRVHSADMPPERVEIVLDRTPLYAESGGQIADAGQISGTGAGESAKAAVTDVQKIGKTLWVHRVNVESGEFVEGDTVIASVDPTWRRGATQGHSGTHMVHAALREVLGPNAVQAGSLNRPGYLRFDFNWQGALSDAQRSQIEVITNEAVQADYPVNTFTTELEKAKSMGAMALFGEQYPDQVRVVEIGGPFSLELCGGTHVHNSARIGPVTILGESSVGSGVRRVEAYVGLDSFRHLAKERALMAGLASSLKVPSDEVPARVANLVERLKAAEKELDRTRLAGARASASNAAAAAEQVGRVRLVAQRMAAGMTATDLRSLVGDIRARLGAEPAVVVLIAESEGSVPFVVATNQAAQDVGLRANDLVSPLAAAVGGRGGGKADLAQGSGTDPSGIDAALAGVRADLARR